MAIWPFGRSKKAKKARDAGASREVPLDEKQVLSAKVQTTASPHRVAVQLGKTTKESPRATKTSKKENKTPTNIRDTAPFLPQHMDLGMGLTTTISAGLMESPESQKSKRGRSKSATKKQIASRKPLQELENPAVSSWRQDAANSKASLGKEEDFTAMPIIPTLTPNVKRASSDPKILRRKSSKRRAEDKNRIEELRTIARTSPIPIPPRPDSGASGLVSRESRRSPALSRRPNSEVSLPLAESLQDSTPDAPESTSYKVNAFDILSPRPTIKYNNHPRYLKSSHGKERAPVLPEADEDDWGSRTRMNELADDLDNHGLRELMDRDRRRRERKRKMDADKVSRKLEKGEKGEKRRSSRSRGRSKGKKREEPKDDPKPSAPPLTIKTVPSENEAPLEQPNYAVRQSFVPSDIGSRGVSRNSPVSPLEDPFQDRLSTDDAIIETAQAVRLEQANLSPPASPIVPRQTKEAAVPESKLISTPDIPEVPEPPPHLQPDNRRDSETSSRAGGGGGGWRSFFQRGQRKPRTSSEKGRGTPSESGFSNTSRESFARTGPSAAAESSFVRVGGSGGPAPPIPERSFRRSSTPQRTRSRFREDLPDVPKETVPPVPDLPHSQPQSPPRSPSQSRVASPEAGSGPPSPFVDNPQMLSTDAAVRAPMEDVHPALREEVALSRGHSVRSSRRESTAAGTGPSAAVLSQSLASVDSEGSWLSGRPSKRSSIITGRPSSNSIGAVAVDDEGRPVRASSPLTFPRRTGTSSSAGNGAAATASSISNQLRSLRHPSQTGETLGVEDRASPVSPTAESSTIPTPARHSNLDPHLETEGATEGGEPILHTATVARSPTVVTRTENTRSREGLLDIFDPEPSSAVVESAESPSAAPVAEPQSAGARHSSSDESPEITGEAEQAEIKRATSVKLKGDRGHARQVSAGSARLLDISRRASGEGSKFGEGRRGSTGSEATRMSENKPSENVRLSRLAQTTSAEEQAARSGQEEAEKEKKEEEKKESS